MIQFRSLFLPANFGPIKFYLWTPARGVNRPLNLQSGARPNDFLNHKFDRNRPSKIICHGWLTNAITFVQPFARGEQCLQQNLFQGRYTLCIFYRFLGFHVFTSFFIAYLDCKKINFQQGTRYETSNQGKYCKKCKNAKTGKHIRKKTRSV